MSQLLIQQLLKQKVLAASRKDPEIFGRYVFRKKNGEVFKPANHIKQWHDFYTNNKRGVILAAPGTGKSTQISQIRSLWELGNNPNLCIAIISRKVSLAERSLRVIRETIENNRQFQEVFPDLKPSDQLWTTSRIAVANRSLMIADPSIQALGVDSSIMGSRLDGVIIDDPQDQTNCSKRDCEKLYEWLESVILSRLSKDGFCFVISNSWDEQDLAHKLIDAGWPYMKNQLICDYNTSEERSLWPEEISYEQCKTIESSIEHSTFLRLYQNDLQAGANSLFNKQWINKALSFNQPIYHNHQINLPIEKIYCGVDLAVSTKETSDFTVFSIVAKRADGFKQLINIKGGHFQAHEIIEHIQSVHHAYRPIFYVENVAAQDYILQMVRRYCPEIMVQPHTTSKTNKLEFAIERLALEFQQDKWILPSSNNKPANKDVESLIDGMMSYRRGEHPSDFLASLCMANEHMLDPSQSIQSVFTNKTIR